MGWAIAGAAGIMVLAILHLLTFSIPEKKNHLAHVSDDHTEAQPRKKLNIRETFATIKEVPGLIQLIFFTTFNNFLGGVFMALMDPYGLLMVSVQTWGMMFGVLSLSFIA